MDDFLKDLEQEEREKEIKKLQHSQENIPTIEDKSLFPFRSISQTLIKEILSHRDDPDTDLNFPLVKEYCPLQVYYKYIAKVYPDNPTENMLKGLYFETKLLGSSAKGKSYDTPPNKKRGLGIPVDYERINKQILNAQKVFFDNFIYVSNVNVQVPLSVYHPKLDIVVSMEMDIFPTPILCHNEIKLSIVDLKLTGDVNNSFGEFGWAEPESMDHIQADLYTYFTKYVYSSDKAMEKCQELNPGFYYGYIFSPNIIKMIRQNGILFHYAVFGYPKENIEHNKRIMERVATQEKEYNMIKRLTYAIELLKEDERNGWKAKPSWDKCKTCLLKNKICDKFNEINKI